MTGTIANLGSLRPFIAPVFLEAAGPLRDAALLDRVFKQTKEIARRNTASTARRMIFESAVDQFDGHFFQA